MHKAGHDDREVCMEFCAADLTISSRYVFLSLARPDTEGRLISVSRRGAGGGGRDNDPCSGDALAWARRSKPRWSRRFERCAEGPDGRWLDARQRRPARAPGSSTVVAYSYACTDGPGDLHGADRLNTARGTPRVWRTCGSPCSIARTSASSEAQDFD